MEFKKEKQDKKPTVFLVQENPYINEKGEIDEQDKL
jgi:hypothetical protein